jgi:hypothetical protein
MKKMKGKVTMEEGGKVGLIWWVGGECERGARYEGQEPRN